VLRVTAAWSLAFEVFKAVEFIGMHSVVSTDHARQKAPQKKGDHTGSTVLSPFLFAFWPAAGFSG
jgi:hypothetical protein